MQIRKNKAGTTIKLTRAEVRQVEAAQEIIDTVRLLGGTAEDIEEGLESDGVISIGPKLPTKSPAEMLEPEGDLEAVEAPKPVVHKADQPVGPNPKRKQKAD